MKEPLVRARGLERVFPGGVGVHGVDLDLSPREVHALVGLNGAGKTTIMRLLLGMLQPDRGTVHIHGCPIVDADAATWRWIGHLIEHPLVYPELDTRTNLELAARLHGVPRTTARSVAERALHELNLGRYADVPARVLSSGNRQRLGLAAVLAHGPDLIILDEPTNALDPAGVILLREVLLRRAESGACVLVSSHHLDEVARIAQHITVINEGHIIGSLDPTGQDIERAFFALIRADDQRRQV